MEGWYSRGRKEGRENRRKGGGVDEREEGRAGREGARD